MSEQTPDHETPDPDDVVETPQAGAAAGGTPSRDNDTPADDETVETPQDDDDDDGDPDDDPDSDETGGDGLARARKQAAKYRRQLRDTETERDELRESLWHARVDSLGLLADPTDLPLDADLLDDPDGIRQAVDDLLARKPHLRSRRIRERAGQGEGSTSTGVSLSALLARRA